MGLLVGRGTLHPAYFRHATPVIEGDMVALIEIKKPYSGATEPVWNEATQEWAYDANEVVWRGMARVQPNKDWRARNREWAQENTAEHAIRVQINLYKNMLYPWPAPPVDLKHGYIVTVVNNPNDPILERYMFTIRNPIGASDNWHRTLLCDANLGSDIDGS